MSDGKPSDLGTILADARADVAVLKRTGAGEAGYIEQLLEKISAAQEDFLTWLSEDKAVIKSGLSRRTLRRRFRELLECGMARYNGKGEREYRSCVIPQRADPVAAKAAATAGEPLRRAS